jgi:hypothetical protein
VCKVSTSRHLRRGAGSLARDGWCGGGLRYGWWRMWPPFSGRQGR